MSEKRDATVDIDTCNISLESYTWSEDDGKDDKSAIIRILARNCKYWIYRATRAEAERDELRDDIAFLHREYGESDEPMTQDALELKARCKVLAERNTWKEYAMAHAALSVAEMRNEPLGDLLKRVYASVKSLEKLGVKIDG